MKVLMCDGCLSIVDDDEAIEETVDFEEWHFHPDCHKEWQTDPIMNPYVKENR